MKPPLSEEQPKSVLVVLPTWVGDFVMATPALRAIRERFAGAQITFLMEPNLRELVRGGDWMDECLEWPAAARRRPWDGAYRRLARELRSRQFDWAVLLPNSARPAVIAYVARAKRRIGYHRNGRGFLLTDRIPVRNLRPAHVVSGAVRLERPRGLTPDTGRQGRAPAAHGAYAAETGIPDRSGGRYEPMPLVEYFADLVEFLGCERPGDALELFTTTDSDESVDERIGHATAGPLVVISPGAKYGAAKCWPAERFAATGDVLTEEMGAQVVVTCGPGEESIARAIGAAMRSRALVLDEPPLTLGELKSLLRRCDLLLCNDAGPRHIGKAFGVPVVTVFGPTHPLWTATAYERERVVRIDIECGPCQQRTCPLGHLQCMTGVSVEMVVGAARDLLAARSAAR